MRFLEWPESAALGVAVAVTTRHGGVSDGPHESLNLGLHVGDDPDRVIEQPETCRPRLRGRTRRAWSSPNRCTVPTPPSWGTPSAGRGRYGWTMPFPPPTSWSRQLSIRRWPSSSPTASPWPWSTPRRVSWPRSMPDGGARRPGPAVRAVEAMERLGADPKRVVAFIGPGVHPARYQVDDRRPPILARAVAPQRLTSEVARAGRARALACRPHGGQPPATRPGRGRPERRIFDCGVTTARRRLLQRSGGPTLRAVRRCWPALRPRTVG